MNSIRTIAIVVFMACYLSACGGRSTPSPPAPPPPVTKTTVLSTVGSVSSAAKGNSVEFIATVEFSDGTMQDVTASATWSSDDTAVLAFNVNGLPNLAWATGVGKATVSATISGAAVGTSLEIDGTPATLKTLHVEPSVIPAGVPIGERGQFEAGGVYSDETTQILTKSVRWSSSDGTKASISNDPGTEGQAVALQAGQATITAELDGKTSGAAGVTIVSSPPKEIVLEPTTAPALLLGRTFPYRAYVVYENNDVDEVTRSVRWDSSDLTVATFPANKAAGTIQGEAVGNTQVTATDEVRNISTTPVTQPITAPTLEKATIEPLTEVQGVSSAPVTLNVIEGALTTLTISPNSVPPIDPGGGSVSFTASGEFAGGVTREMTENVTWTTSDRQIARVSNEEGSWGEVQSGSKAGTATITATDNKRFGATGISASELITVRSGVPPVNLLTVAQIKLLAGGKIASARGQAVERLDDDNWLFRDSTGDLELEWESQPEISLNVDIELTGIWDGNELEVAT